MKDLVPYGLTLLLVAAACWWRSGRTGSPNGCASRRRRCSSSLAAVASDLVPRLGRLSIVTDQRIVTVALVVILFDGGMHIGWRRMRPAAGAVGWSAWPARSSPPRGRRARRTGCSAWTGAPALLLGAALAPTDPAVVFSVLGRREIAGPHRHAARGRVRRQRPGRHRADGQPARRHRRRLAARSAAALGQFALQLAVGAVVGVAGGLAAAAGACGACRCPTRRCTRCRRSPSRSLLYGVATRGRTAPGFLAVFLAGILVGDARAPYKREIGHFRAGAGRPGRDRRRSSCSGSSSTCGRLVHGRRLGRAGARGAARRRRPAAARRRCSAAGPAVPRGAAFVLFAGLKGAVPILLGTYVAGRARCPTRERIYDVIFVVVVVSVVVQGGLVPLVARLLRVPMRVVEAEPWALGMRFRDEPRGLHRYVVASGSPADGCTLSELDVGENFWVSMVSREGRLVQVRGTTVLRSGDEVLALADDEDGAARVGNVLTNGPSTRA